MILPLVALCLMGFTSSAFALQEIWEARVIQHPPAQGSLVLGTAKREAMFLKVGDSLYLWQQNDPENKIKVVVEDASPFRLKVKGMKHQSFRVGTLMHLEGAILVNRVVQAQQNILNLTEKRKQLLSSIEESNRKIWGFQLDRGKLIKEFELKEQQLKKEKELAVLRLGEEHQRYLKMRREFKKDFDQVEYELTVMNPGKVVMNHPYFWEQDQNLGKEVMPYPKEEIFQELLKLPSDGLID